MAPLTGIRVIDLVATTINRQVPRAKAMNASSKGAAHVAVFIFNMVACTSYVAFYVAF